MLGYDVGFNDGVISLNSPPIVVTKPPIKKNYLINIDSNAYIPNIPLVMDNNVLYAQSGHFGIALGLSPRWDYVNKIMTYEGYGQVKEFKCSIYDDTAYVPVKEVAEAFGLKTQVVETETQYTLNITTK
jgi:hypothetical protein